MPSLDAPNLLCRLRRMGLKIRPIVALRYPGRLTVRCVCGVISEIDGVIEPLTFNWKCPERSCQHEFRVRYRGQHSGDVQIQLVDSKREQLAG